MIMEHILTWLGKESACLVNDEPNRDLEEGRNQVSFIRISSVEKLSDDTIQIEWRGWGQRRGVCFIGDGDGIYLGYSPAGNGTGAVMFPIPPTSSYYKDLLVELGKYAIRHMEYVPRVFDHLESESIEF
jgi:hypothetical protein